jgi:hypothetical protein
VYCNCCIGNAAGVPRANKAVSVETPNGSPAHLAREDYTVMQQHVAFFDRCADVLHDFQGLHRFKAGFETVSASLQ